MVQNILTPYVCKDEGKSTMQKKATIACYGFTMLCIIKPFKVLNT